MMLAQACLTEVIQGQFKDTDDKLALIVFLHTHGRNGSYNPHLHVILVVIWLYEPVEENINRIYAQITEES